MMCFLNLEPRKHIALHQIHKIMFFLATSYDPFNETSLLKSSEVKCPNEQTMVTFDPELWKIKTRVLQHTA